MDKQKQINLYRKSNANQYQVWQTIS